ATRAAGVDDIWTWGYEACGHMTDLATPDAPLVWEAVTRALTRRPALELRPTRALVRSINVGDTTVPDAVADASDQIAVAIDAIVARLEGVAAWSTSAPGRPDESPRPTRRS